MRTMQLFQEMDWSWVTEIFGTEIKSEGDFGLAGTGSFELLFDRSTFTTSGSRMFTQAAWVRELYSNLSETGRRTFLFVPQVNINRASFNSRTNQFITGHGPFVTYLHGFGLWSHDRCVCGAKGDPNHYATIFPVTKPFHFTKTSAENLSTWCENIVQDKRSRARLMNIMKIHHERRHDIIMD
ncbi:hypothetical protein AVEN_110013-1 [Araneus ventricosus]|uniref:Uncharacterized protein n=1 Tax=Araneus ventricosus TaxID=182803 RepID=A0A4Y2JA26_ARAVE|nr:hypothetical protein AVEN_110013-1 [Araneus ventricosus]